MEKKPYHHKNLKNDLIEKGIELVNKNGINQLSLRKVAQACGVSHAAPYSHFSNKEELLQEMQLHITKKFTEVLENTVSQYRGTPIFLLEFGKAYISFFISHPQYFNFLFQQGNIQIDLNIDSGRESVEMTCRYKYDTKQKRRFDSCIICLCARSYDSCNDGECSLRIQMGR